MINQGSILKIGKGNELFIEQVLWNGRKSNEIY